MSEAFDVAVIGGGIHGVGVAQAAAAAGHKVLVLEQRALAAGTSSRSSKLIHGGLRYLEGGHYGLVRAALHERALLLRLAPDLVRLVPFHIPVYRHTRRAAATIALGLALYAMLGNLAPAARFRRVPRAAWDALDGLNREGLRTVFRYYDAQTDDAALTRAVMQSAASLGARLCCPAEFLGAQREGEDYVVRYRDSAEHECRARVLVNAAGAWVDRVAARIARAPQNLALELIQGTHVLIRGELRAGCYYLEAHDGRAVFALPSTGARGILIGTTETRYSGDPALVQPLPQEMGYLEQTFRRYFPHHDYKPLHAFAGVRVLPAAESVAFQRPRETRFVVDNRPPGYGAIYGGKLTTYRATAARLMDALAATLPRRRRHAHTDRLPLTPVE